jgi:centractin
MSDVIVLQVGLETPNFYPAFFSSLFSLFSLLSPQEYRGLLKITHPMEHGIVTDWNDMEKLWGFVYGKEQLNIPHEEHPVLLTEALSTPARTGEEAAKVTTEHKAPLDHRANVTNFVSFCETKRIQQIFFEAFNIPALFVSMQAVLSLFGSENKQI